jgi:hypothetical protein
MSQKYLAGTNRYTERLSTFMAEELLSLMRPEIEPILAKHLKDNSAPSQSYRAKLVKTYLFHELQRPAGELSLETKPRCVATAT